MTETSVDLIDTVRHACLSAADTAMRAGGFVPQPQLHMWLDRWEQPYLGYLLTRPYREGVDAVEAITRDAPFDVVAWPCIWDSDLDASPGRGCSPVRAFCSPGIGSCW